MVRIKGRRALKRLDQDLNCVNGADVSTVLLFMPLSSFIHLYV